MINSIAAYETMSYLHNLTPLNNTNFNILAGQIADAMPDFNRIGTAFQDTPSVRGVLALIYEDILEFHRRAYKFLRRRGMFNLLIRSEL